MTTPAELVADISAGFDPLLISEPVVKSLYNRAARYIQDFGAPKGVLIIEHGDKDKIATLPDNAISILSVADENFVSIDHTYDVPTRNLRLQSDRWTDFPVTVSYLVNFTNIDYEKDHLPTSIIGNLERYLAALISIPNTERSIRANEAAGLSSDGKITASELKAEVERIEEQIAKSSYLSLMPTVAM